MELVPILSTIILVATIATFILAIAAYILYKARERKARQNVAERREALAMQEQPHMLVTPQGAPAGMLGGEPRYIGQGTGYVDPSNQVYRAPEALPPASATGYGNYSQPQQAPPQHALPPPYSAPATYGEPVRPQPMQQQEPARPFLPPQTPPQSPNSMFWEYTEGGFVPVDPRQSTQQEVERRALETAQEQERRAQLAQDEAHRRALDVQQEAERRALEAQQEAARRQQSPQPPRQQPPQRPGEGEGLAWL